MNLLFRTLARLKKYWRHMIVSIILTVAYALLSGFSIWMLIPFIGNIFDADKKQEIIQFEKKVKVGTLADFKAKIKNQVDELVEGKTKQDTLKRLCILIVVVYFLKNLIGYAQSYTMYFIEQSVARDFRDSLYRHLHRLSLMYFHQHKTGELISTIISDIRIVNETIGMSLIYFIRDPVLLLSYLAIMILLSWKLTLMVLLVTPLSLFIIVKIGAKLKRYSARSQEGMAEMISILQETISGIRIVKAFAMERFEIEKFKKELNKFLKTMLKMARVGRAASPINEFLGVLFGMIILWVGGNQVLSGAPDALRPEEFIVFLVALFMLMQPARNLSRANNKIQVGLAAAERVFRMLDTKPRVADRPDAIGVNYIRDSIRFEDISFRYDDNDAVLSDVNLDVKAGEMVAIVGPSGAGKSTLVDLIPRFYDPSKGRITIDGVDLRDIQIDSLRGMMGIVTQETVLFNDTLWNNIAYGLSDIAEERVIEAAKAANAHDFIVEFAGGYETIIGDRGVKLSGGQRQRIAIARAILKDPPILILDEATSSLDTESEALVQEAVERLMENRTSVVIAHRLSTIRKAHRIIVIDEGRIVQQGTHRDLIAGDGVYKKLYGLQFSHFHFDDTLYLKRAEEK